MLLACLLTVAQARSLAGVTLPDSVVVGGQSVPLNGIGLREKLFIDVYVGGLYLQHPTQDAAAAIGADEPKRLVMHFVYGPLSKAQLLEAFDEGFAGQPGVVAQQAAIDRLRAVTPALVNKGEELAFDYTPGVGTTFLHNGKALATVPGEAFMKMVWTIYLGPKPPTPDLKKGLLGP